MSMARKEEGSEKPSVLLVGLGRALICFLGCMPRSWCRKWGRVLGYVFFAILKVRAQVTTDNIRMVYGEWCAYGEARRLARDNFGHWGEVLFEILHAAGRPGGMKPFLQMEGLEHLRTALRKDRGVVLFSAHIGNFLFLPAALRDFSQTKFIYRKPSSATAEVLYAWVRERLSIRVIADSPRQASASQCLKHIAGRGILGALIDQVEVDGVYVDFMGHPAGSTAGAAVMALRKRAPLIPARCIRRRDGTWAVIIEPELQIRREGGREECVNDAVAVMNRRVEAWVRENPRQWFWPHRRWRAWKKGPVQPSGAPHQNGTAGAGGS